ncbi:hypothetical protein CLAIMM_01242 [Cladophialophora immunda]|nr:hypothetical protein CLAIMM_01242 [Cladophialophora immunda]
MILSYLSRLSGYGSTSNAVRRFGSTDADNYSVGWICDISTEYVAAQAFLDEKHDGPKFVSTNDNNDYTLGRVGKHNVVIAVAPDGEYGTNSAASVARDMVHSFPNVRIGLLVGIAGGVPSQKNDIRLGDIVVSAPRDGKGGVFQYDFGKERQNQGFQTTGILNQPPTILRTAVAGLRAQYESDGHRLKETIGTTLENKKRLQQKYTRPDPETDRLYLPEVAHPPNDERDCSEACSSDLSRIVVREPRTEDEDDPAIHYGLIASGNRLIKDSSIREDAAKYGVLCFEMAAAGVMNHFPCLVVRGICDYSDSHKYMRWQGYAAMAAAAYAKDLLLRIAPNRVEAEKKIMETVSESVLDVQKDVKAVANEQTKRTQQAILHSLSPTDFVSLQNDFMAKHQPGTGQWFLDSQEYHS